MQLTGTNRSSELDPLSLSGFRHQGSGIKSHGDMALDAHPTARSKGQFASSCIEQHARLASLAAAMWSWDSTSQADASRLRRQTPPAFAEDGCSCIRARQSPEAIAGTRRSSAAIAACFSPAWWLLQTRSDPIPSRTRPSNAQAPMVLCLKTWESRSSPGLQRTHSTHEPQTSTKTAPNRAVQTPLTAGWSSPVARQAHNLKVTGSNPVPATKSPPQTQKPWANNPGLRHIMQPAPTYQTQPHEAC